VARIFKVVCYKMYIEQESNQIQREAMMPSKKAKMMTSVSYTLLEEHFLKIRTIWKAGGRSTGPAKAFYLFYANRIQLGL
jgi:hypothetical protein